MVGPEARRSGGACSERQPAVEAAPEELFGHRQLAARLLKSGQARAAVKACRQGLRIDPADAELHLLLGNALMKRAGASTSETDLVESRFSPPQSDQIQEIIYHFQ